MYNHYIYIVMSDKAKLIIKVIIAVVCAALAALGSALGLSGCNVTRTMTNESKYLQKGDTSVVIQTKTIEKYDASKKL